MLSTRELRCALPVSRIVECDTMSESEWRLLATLTDLPSAQSLAEVLASEGVSVRVNSDAGVLGQAAPAEIYVSASQLHRAKWLLAQGEFSDEELTTLSGAEPPLT